MTPQDFISKRSSLHRLSIICKLPSTSPKSKSPKLPTLLHRRTDSYTSEISDYDAVYYQDPETRSKLKEFLISPQKFDEALNFGFPAADQLKKSSRQSSLSFLDGEDQTHVDEQADDKDTISTISDVESPDTPAADMHELPWKDSEPNRLSMFGGLDSDSIPSLDFQFKPPPPLPPPPPMPSLEQVVNMEREMTLRMTLTRADLRDSDNNLYGWRQNTEMQEEDPITLRTLTSISENNSGVHAVTVTEKPQREGNSSVLHKILRRVNLRK